MNIEPEPLSLARPPGERAVQRLRSRPAALPGMACVRVRRNLGPGALAPDQGARVLAARLTTALLIAALLGGCAVVRELQPAVAVQPLTPREYVEQRRGDLFTTDRPSALTVETLRSAGLELDACAVSWSLPCLLALAEAEGLDDERRLSALAELWLQRAMLADGPAAGEEGASSAAMAPWLEVARHAYAYLFFTDRAPGARALEDRQTQVRDWYNYAVQQTVTQLFAARRQRGGTWLAGRRVRLGGWMLHVESGARLPGAADLPDELLPAPALSFKGLRSVYRRDGFGAELVAVLPLRPRQAAGLPSAASQAPDAGALPVSWSEVPASNLTALLRFQAETLEQLLAAREVTVSLHDPLVEAALALHGQRVPLAGNFSAGYGLWLARSDFSRQSLRSLLGRELGLDHPHLYLLQPFDPNRRVIVLLHGLASSPEAWVNVANELLGDEALRQNFQAWLVHYPTNLPLAANHAAIRALLAQALCDFDPRGRAPASQNMVLIGHSMGGVIARLMVSSAGEQLRTGLAANLGMDTQQLVDSQPLLDSILHYQPMAGVGRALFIAAPHRGTTVAEHALVRWLAGFIRLPLTFLQGLDRALQAQAATADAPALTALPNSVDQLSAHDPFVRAAADLPISDRVVYHSIIARQDAAGALADSDDGLVPYRSAHLPGAASERVIVSGHSVQENARAILEIRRILHQDLADAQSMRLQRQTIVRKPQPCASWDQPRGDPACATQRSCSPSLK